MKWMKDEFHLAASAPGSSYCSCWHDLMGHSKEQSHRCVHVISAFSNCDKSEWLMEKKKPFTRTAGTVPSVLVFSTGVNLVPIDRRCYFCLAPSMKTRHSVALYVTLCICHHQLLEPCEKDSPLAGLPLFYNVGQTQHWECRRWWWLSWCWNNLNKK